MDFESIQHSAPLLFLLCAGMAAIFADLFFSQRIKAIAYYVVQVSLLIVFVFGLSRFLQPDWVGFHGLFADDALARVLTLSIVLLASVAFLYSRVFVTEFGMPTGEYYVLALFSIIGMIVLVSAHSFVTIYLGLELLSLPLYAMVALRRDDPICVEAAVKYFIMGAIASGILLYGLSLMYGATGHLDIDNVANIISQTDPMKQSLMNFAAVFIIAGFCFKLAAAPFHMWAPDVYTGAPTSVTLFLGTVPKLAAFGMAARLLTMAFPDLLSAWQPVLIVISIASMGIGNVMAMAQSNIKRMLAYSAIAHAGYMLLGLIAGSEEGYTAALFYMINYALMSVAVFGMLTMYSRQARPIETIEDFRGLSTRAPWIALMMMIVMLSMAGVPPVVGFFAKLLVLKALVGVELVWLPILALLFAVFGAFYYIRIIKLMYFDAPVSGGVSEWQCTRDQHLLLSVNALILLVLGLFPGLLLRPCQIALGA